MVTPTPESILYDGMTPLERELALASFGPDAAHEPARDGYPHGAAATADASGATLRAPHNPHLAHWRTHLNGLATRSHRALPL
ncbi:flagellum-specific ATP synthase FliI, partial [Burkholderia sp. Ac-20344]|nr:flagellum-specific ATP synthase FliI [Burkholderia sp. Ac-20344]